MKKMMRSEMRARVSSFVGLSSSSSSIAPSCLPPDRGTVFAFLPTKYEIDTIPLIRSALEKGMTVAVPRVHEKEMHFHQITSADGPFEKGPFGIREPPGNSPSVFPPAFPFPLLVLVPGLAFTRSGDRLGKGGGYYDRFLAGLLAAFPEERKNIILAGAAWSVQIVDSIPVESHDIPVNCLYTENGCILCV